MEIKIEPTGPREQAKRDSGREKLRLPFFGFIPWIFETAEVVDFPHERWLFADRKVSLLKFELLRKQYMTSSCVLAVVVIRRHEFEIWPIKRTLFTSTRIAVRVLLLAWEHQPPRQQAFTCAQIASSDFTGSLLCTISREKNKQTVIYDVLPRCWSDSHFCAIRMFRAVSRVSCLKIKLKSLEMVKSYHTFCNPPHPGVFAC